MYLGTAKQAAGEIRSASPVLLYSRLVQRTQSVFLA